MSLYDLSTSIASFLILITMYARLNDINREQKSPIWWVRRVAFLMVIAACAMQMMSPVSSNVKYWFALKQQLFVWGVFFVFFSTPFQRPWWQYLTGSHRTRPTESNYPLGRRVRDEFSALRDSFKGTQRPVERRVGPADRRKQPDRRFNTPD